MNLKKKTRDFWKPYNKEFFEEQAKLSTFYGCAIQSNY